MTPRHIAMRLSRWHKLMAWVKAEERLLKRKTVAQIMELGGQECVEMTKPARSANAKEARN